MKRVQYIYPKPAMHWVGDGFPVHSLFSYHQQGGQNISPFLLLDHAGPTQFPPSQHLRGVGQYPHRGFETVTIVYKGEVSHHDSTGQGGTIGEGEVQWMTAGRGIIHEEYHSEHFAQHGGDFEMVQLWVNLPAQHKMTPPNYQAISRNDIPIVALDHQAGVLRVIAGTFAEAIGPANTHTPMNVWDVHLNAHADLSVDLPEQWNTFALVLDGTVLFNQDTVARAGQLVQFTAAGERLDIASQTNATILLLSGEPIREPVVGHGPFVMNTAAEITQAFEDFSKGEFV